MIITFIQKSNHYRLVGLVIPSKSSACRLHAPLLAALNPGRTAGKLVVVLLGIT